MTNSITITTIINTIILFIPKVLNLIALKIFLPHTFPCSELMEFFLFYHRIAVIFVVLCLAMAMCPCWFAYFVVIFCWKISHHAQSAISVGIQSTMKMPMVICLWHSIVSRIISPPSTTCKANADLRPGTRYGTRYAPKNDPLWCLLSHFTQSLLFALSHSSITCIQRVKGPHVWASACPWYILLLVSIG